VLLAKLVETWAAVAATPARRGKVDLLAARLRELAPGERLAGVAFLTGVLRQRQIGVGWAAVRAMPPPAAAATLSVAGVDSAFAEIGATAGAGSQAHRRDLLMGLFGAATEPEQRFLSQLLVGELRQGAAAGVMADSVARAADVPLAAIRRALLFGGDLRAVAVAALDDGAAGLAGFRLRVGRPLAPMLAGTAPDVATALVSAGPAAVDTKLDGVRIQVHRSGADVAVFTRSLDEITARVPEVVDAALGIDASEFVLDGEAIALRVDGRPQPFQVTSSRLGSRTDIAVLRDRTPLTPVFFDLLHLDGADLVDEPLRSRLDALTGAAAAAFVVDRVVAPGADDAAAFVARSLAAGHEGVVVKSLDSPYAAGRRGGGWLKVKPSHTLDLVVLAAEWGHGRRRGYLSNLHLGAREVTGGFVMLGKTFKGLTDEMLGWQTERLQELAVDRGEWVVTVRPELVVEVAFDGVQASTRYPGGVALRFARVKGYRNDKSPADADTIDAVRALHGGP